MDESVLLGTKSLVESVRHSIRDLSGVFSVWHACECHIAHWRHDSRHFYFVEWTWFLVPFRFVVSKHRQAALICLIKGRERMSFPKNSTTRTWLNGNLDDFKAFKENSSQGISQSARCCKEENKSSWKLSAIKTLLHRIQVKVSDVFSFHVLRYLVEKYFMYMYFVWSEFSWCFYILDTDALCFLWRRTVICKTCSIFQKQWNKNRHFQLHLVSI